MNGWNMTFPFEMVPFFSGTFVHFQGYFFTQIFIEGVRFYQGGFLDAKASAAWLNSGQGRISL